ncbi:MAG: PAS domain-containing protein [Syntrophobacterales bacterium]|nr:PAS domain-containing protein [Syntrophobacterales bacterium]
MKSHLSSKFLISFLVVGIVVFATASIWLQSELKKELLVRFEEELTAEAGIIATMPVAKIRANAEKLSRLARARLTLIDAEGKVLADTLSSPGKMESHLNRSEIQEARLRGKGEASRYSSTLQEKMFYVAVPLASETPGYVRLARPVTEVALLADAKGRMFLGILLAIIIIYLLTSAYLTVRLLSPIRRLILFTGRVRAGDFSGSLLVKAPDDIGELAGNIKEMVEYLRERLMRAEEARHKLEAVFAGMEEGVMLLDAEGRIESLNRSMEMMIARPQEEAIGKTLIEVLRNAGLHDALKRFRETGESVCEEIAIGDEHPVVMSVTIAALNSETGGGQKMLLAFNDVTRLKGLERIRTDFIANVTHEIRTPLTAIIGFAETLRQGALENREMAGRFIDTIRENAERLNRLVDDLTTLSVLELGEARLQREGLSLAEEVKRALLVTGGRAGQKGLAMRMDIPQDLPLIFADRDRLTQILINIIDNALKFTPEGGIISLTALPEGDDFLALIVADTGPGIPEAELPRLGERFYRADKTRSRKLGGTGLGLSIVKHLMKAHGGRMNIQSAPGKGTTVSLSFPVFRKTENAHD